jgi:hypothetical protein
MKSGKIFIVNGRAKVNPPQPPSPPLSALPAMTVGGWGDPHLYITTSSTDSKNRVSTKTIAQWGDNKPGTAGNNELQLLDLQTSADSIKIYYTNKAYGSAKIISNIRVVYNTVSTTYNSTTRLTLGPVTLNILKAGSGSSAYLTFEMSWSNINNIVKLGGALVPILKRVADNNGVLWNGGDGATWDGFGKALAPYGLTRSSFETGIGVQSLSEELILSEKEANFLSVATENFTQNGSIFDNLQNLGENGEGDNAAIGDWDPTHAEVLPVLSDNTGLVGAINIEIGPEPTPTATATPTRTPTTTPSSSAVAITPTPTTSTAAPSVVFTVTRTDGLGSTHPSVSGNGTSTLQIASVVNAGVYFTVNTNCILTINSGIVNDGTALNCYPNSAAYATFSYDSSGESSEKISSWTAVSQSKTLIANAEYVLFLRGYPTASNYNFSLQSISSPTATPTATLTLTPTTTSTTTPTTTVTNTPSSSIIAVTPTPTVTTTPSASPAAANNGIIIQSSVSSTPRALVGGGVTYSPTFINSDYNTYFNQVVDRYNTYITNGKLPYNTFFSNDYAFYTGYTSGEVRASSSYNFNFVIPTVLTKYRLWNAFSANIINNFRNGGRWTSQYGYYSYLDTGNQTPQGWKIQGSNDDYTWTDVDVRTSQARLPYATSNDASTSTYSEFTISSPQAYKAYKFLITSPGRDSYQCGKGGCSYDWQLGEIQLWGYESPTTPCALHGYGSSLPFVKYLNSDNSLRNIPLVMDYINPAPKDSWKDGCCGYGYCYTVRGFPAAFYKSGTLGHDPNTFKYNNVQRTWDFGWEAEPSHDYGNSRKTPVGSIADTGYLSFDFPIFLTSYKFRASGINKWTIYGSNNFSSWTTLDDRSNATATMSNSFSISNPQSFKYYKIEIKGSSSTYSNKSGTYYYGVLNDIQFTGYLQ